MELHKLQILQYCAGPIGHSNTVAGCNFGSGSFAIELPCSAGCQYSIRSPDYLWTSATVTTDDSRAPVIVVGEQIDDVEIFQYLYVLILPNLFYERLCNNSACLIAVSGKRPAENNNLLIYFLFNDNVRKI